MSNKRVRLGDVLHYEQPTKYIVSSEEYNDSYSTPVLTAGKSFILGYSNEEYGIYDNLPAIIFDDFTTESKYVDFKFKVKSSAMKILTANKEVANIRYMFYLLQTLNELTSQHKRYWISKFANIEIELPPLHIQHHIADVLDKADALRQKDQLLFEKYDELAQSIFYDMFGDPVKNEKGWEVKKLKNIGVVKTGNTPPRANSNYYGDYIEWIKTDNILFSTCYPQKATEFLSQLGERAGRTVDAGSILVTCIAGSETSIGNCVLTNRKVAFNQQINSFTPSIKMDSIFMYYLFRENKKLIQNSTTKGMKRIITKSNFEKLEFILPPVELQTKFTKKIVLCDKQKDNHFKNVLNSGNLFGTLLNKFFN